MFPVRRLIFVRGLCAQTMSTNYFVKDTNNTVEIGDSQTREKFHYFWLRDHCRCVQCYNDTTQQRKLDIMKIPWDITITAHNLDGDQLNVLWSDEHKSTYSLPWLMTLTYQNFVSKLIRQPIIWTSDDVSTHRVARICYDSLDNSDSSYSLLKSLIDYGVAFVEKVPANVEATEKVVRSVAHVQHTLFGGMWEFSDVLDHSDTAYTKDALGPHTDNTYFTEAAGLQILHCLNHDGSGGENLLVDGFKAVAILKERYPEVFERLTQTLTEAEYREQGEHHEYLGPIIRLHPVTHQVEQIRFNLNDRAPLCSLPQDRTLQFYQDLRTFASIVQDPVLEWRFKLRPGTVLFFDNFRLLHGRTAYTGHRTMCGCYVARSDYLSKARVLGLI